MVMTRPPAYHPGNFLMKNMNPTNSGLINKIVTCTIPPDSNCVHTTVQTKCCSYLIKLGTRLL